MNRFRESIAFGTRMGILSVKAAAHRKQALNIDINNPLHQGALGAAIGGGGTALYDLLAGTEDNKLQRALLGAGLGGAGGVGLGAVKRMADDYASARIKEERDKVQGARKGSGPKKLPYAKQDELMDKPTLSSSFGPGRKKIDMQDLLTPAPAAGKPAQGSGAPEAPVGIDTSTLRSPALLPAVAAGEIMGLGARPAVKALSGVVDDVKNVIHKGAVTPLKDLFMNKLQETEANRVAANRDALMANSTGNAMGDILKIPAINNQPKDRPSTAIPDSLLSRPKDLYRYDSKNQADFGKYHGDLAAYRKLLSNSPPVSTPSLPGLGAPTSQADIDRMRQAISNGRP